MEEAHDTFFQELLNDHLGRNYLNHVGDPEMQGSEFAPVPDGESDWLEATLESLPNTGVVTGLPSPRFRTEGYVNLLQALDRLTYGIRDEIGQRDYALIVLAEPVRDEEICALNNTFLQLRSDIHRCVAVSESVGANTGQNSGNNVSTGGNLGGLIVAAKAIAGDPAVLYSEAADKKTEFNVDYGHHWGRSFGTTENYSHEERNFAAAYCEDLVSKHISRLQSGRSLGFWNTGIYVLGDNSNTVDTVLGMLRSIYAGKESYVEPIRVFNTGRSQAVSSYLHNMRLLPLPGSERIREIIRRIYSLPGDSWHVFGPLYESLSTPLTTEELSLATSLPQRDVPGLRFVRNSVKFAANPPQPKKAHLYIVPHSDGGVFIEDLGSTNGTFLNGQRIYGPVSAPEGSRVTLANVDFSLLKRK